MIAFYGTIHGAGSFFDPNSLSRDNRYITPQNDPEYQPETYYYTDAISDNAVAFIRDHVANHENEPFFLPMWPIPRAHWPMHALPRDIAKYEGKYDSGYGPVREERVKRLREMGLLPDHWEVTPQVGDWGAVPNKEWEIGLHGSLCRDGRQHGPGDRSDRRGARGSCPV